ncbi:MAG: SusC/RagA family TonB-linked outer membrane protein [Tannerellaceae bacterium]|jgi:TonB-linked SusC/RagA family outer membrane protein|nr:SusC/RagA family TonB-linked outer membrane protein [Tannerellaceae bacterium]
MKKKLINILLCFMICTGMAVAQNKRVTGTVVSDDDGEPIIGASVIVKGTSIGSITNLDGQFELNAPASAAFLIISYLGMESQEVAIQPNLRIVLKASTQNLEEVVVTALGISRDKKTLGYAVQQVDGDDINTTKTNNFVAALSGKVSGLQIKNTTNFGGSVNVLIRGASSLTQNNQALFVVDGVPIDNSNVNHTTQRNGGIGYDYGNTASDINPNDIESVSVLKGAAATALYGSRAGSGVILITTKKGGGASKKPVVRLSSNVTLSNIDMATMPGHQKEYGAGYGQYYDSPNGFFDYADIDGDGLEDLLVPYYEDASRGGKLDGTPVYQWDSFYPTSSNYGKKTPYVASPNGPEYFFKTGVSLTNSIDVSGGSDVSTYRFAYTNLDQTGTMPNSSIKRNSASFSGSYNILPNLTISSSANYIHTSALGRPPTGYNDNMMSMFRQWYQANVDIKQLEEVYKSSGLNATWNRVSWDDGTPAYWDNPYWSRYENYETDRRQRLIAHAKLEWKLTDYLSLMGRYAIDTYGYLQEERKAVGSHAERFGVGMYESTSGYARLDRSFIETNVDLLANFHKTIGSNFDLTALAGVNIRRSTLDQVYASTNNGLSVPGVFALSNSLDPMLPPEEDYERIGINGLFASASLGYQNTYYIEGTIRRDQASTLPAENNAYIYPSLTGSVIFSNLFKQDWLSFGKLRLNFAEVGNSAPALSVRDSYTPVSPFNGNAMVTVPDTRNNPNLKPERQQAFEAGLEAGFLNNRVGFDLAIYNNRTFDQLLPLNISYATGYDERWINAGEIENKGVELSLFATPVKTKNFSWDVKLNWATNRNKVVSLYVDETGHEVDNLQLGSLQGGVTINARVGKPYGVISGTDYVYHENGGRIIDVNGIYKFTPGNDIVLGNVNPDWTGGLSNTLTYKNFSLNFLIDAQSGGSVFSLDMHYGGATGVYKESAGQNDLGNPKRDPIVWADPKDHSKGYAPNSGGTVLPGVREDGTPNTIRVDESSYIADGYKAKPNSAFVFDASFVKLRELSLTYTFPKTLLAKSRAISGASLSIVGSNLWIIHKNLPYADPEATQSSGNIQGWQSGVAPTERNIGLTLNVQF